MNVVLNDSSNDLEAAEANENQLQLKEDNTKLKSDLKKANETIGKLRDQLSQETKRANMNHQGLNDVIKTLKSQLDEYIAFQKKQEGLHQKALNKVEKQLQEALEKVV